MKGVSLAIETIIILILAVAVMSVLLFFLRSAPGDAKDLVTQINRQNAACSDYVYYDAECDGNNIRGGTVPSETLNNIAGACKTIYEINGQYSECKDKTTISPSNAEDRKCLVSCCRISCTG